jgi:hypothetical protein
MKVSYELHDPFVLTLTKSHGAHWIGGWVGPRASDRFGEQKNLLPLNEIRTPDRWAQA